MAPSSEYSPLMGERYDDSGRQPSSQTIKQAKRATLINRVLIVLLLVAVTVLAVIFQSKIVNLNSVLSQDEDRITELQGLVESQGKVIQRFNDSVSNSDVLIKLHELEQSLQQTQTHLEGELSDFTVNVGTQLNQTMASLDATVKKAESDINNEVTTMKTSFEKYVVDTQAQFSMENSFMVYQIAGTLVLLSCLISCWHMSSHLRKLRQPAIQRKILAILWMSPIYAITSWFSLVFHSAEGYLAIIKDAYEAYIIYQFLSFCIAVMGKGDRNAVVDILAKRADHLSPPFSLFGLCCKGPEYENNRALADAILLQCQFFALQFVFFRPLTTIATVFLNKYEYFGPFGATSANDYRAPQMYVALIQNISIFTAFTGLLKFYHAVDKDLAWCRPFAKFLCIKGVVFMTFWQGLAITILAETTDVGGSDAEEWAKSAQNFLICLEMLVFSIAHFYCFPVEEWEPNYRADYNNKAKFGDSLALGDFMDDLKLILRSSGKGKKKKKRASVTPSEPTVPEGNEETDNGDDITTIVDEDDDDDDDDDESTTARNAGSDDGASQASDTNELSHDIEEALSSAISRNMSDIGNREVQGAAERVLSRLSSSASSNDDNDDDDGDDTNGGDSSQRLDDGRPSEQTRLLASSSTSSSTSSQRQQDEMLRPSIFTSIAERVSPGNDAQSNDKSS